MNPMCRLQEVGATLMVSSMWLLIVLVTSWDLEKSWYQLPEAYYGIAVFSCASGFIWSLIILAVDYYVIPHEDFNHNNSNTSGSR